MPNQQKTPARISKKSAPKFLTVYAGEILREDFMRPLGLTAAKIAKALPRNPDYPARDYALEITDFAKGDDSFVGFDLSLALDRYFGLPAGYFARLQTTCLIRDSKIRDADWLVRVRPRSDPPAKLIKASIRP
jgi:plasmid maintenance system antidote protein VapI